MHTCLMLGLKQFGGTICPAYRMPAGVGHTVPIIIIVPQPAFYTIVTCKRIGCGARGHDPVEFVVYDILRLLLRELLLYKPVVTVIGISITEFFDHLRSDHLICHWRHDIP